MAARWPLFAINLVLLPLAILLFASGFFPYKPFIPGLATFGEEYGGSRPPAPFDKVIFMVVDALRRLIRSGDAMPFTAHAGAPTITMPRVKAITTGSVPSFLDVILNFAESDTSSTLIHQDTWLAQIKARPGGRLVMYGDDTWLKLFPGLFDRHDGTTSFFVSDFVEVDNNVTRHVPQELRMDDWSAMIMHYLGLDHIGHKAGPGSPHMIPKQSEMDSVVKEIYGAMENQEHLSSTLLVLCGDHGMNDAGNHGAASSGETSPALVFISPKIRQLEQRNISPEKPREDFQYYQSVEQSDIAPTLAGLLGFPVPLNSLGVFIPQFLPMWREDSEKLEILLENAKQIRDVVRTTFPVYEFSNNYSPHVCSRSLDTDIASLECDWQNTLKLAGAARADSSHFKAAEDALLTFSRSAQNVMSSTASNYNLTRLYIGIGITTVIFILSIISSLRLLGKSLGAIPFGSFITITYGAMMFGSSYVEEEQQFWYWVLSGWMFYLLVRPYVQGPIGKNNRPYGPSKFRRVWNVFLFALASRIVRRWNQTGQKFTADPDIAKGFLRNHTNLLWMLILLVYTDICQRMVRRVSSTGPASVLRLLFPILTSFAFLFKLSFTLADSPELVETSVLLSYLTDSVKGVPLVFQVRLVFLGLGLATVFAIRTEISRREDSRVPVNARNRKKDLLIPEVDKSLARTVFSAELHDIISLLLVTQSRSTNIPLYLLFRLQHSTLSTMELSGNEITITSLILQYATFFALGGSNSIASVDLSSAYNGISGYNVFLVGMLTFIGNWAGPIWWVFSTHSLFKAKERDETRRGHLALLTVFVTGGLLGVMVACTVLRTHLFIWTVFSPKFLYSMAWSLAQHLVVNLLFGEVVLGSVC
ncbi:major facilitator super transporter protein [Onygenales sp. PD_12]|nr:major facilitator super transporter protein [Emmonsiellopsis sp. PD_33]KAK2794951.1 major facilitator super transporter protein [Onygenales sp. PD_12]